MLRNGIETVGQSGTGFSTPVNINPVGTQEVNVGHGGGAAPSITTGGVRINIIPREGGNTFNGAFFTSYASPSWQGDNITQELQAPRADGRPIESRTTTTSTRGSAVRSSRTSSGSSCRRRYKNSANYAAGMYYNKNQNNPNVWVFEPDLSRPAANPSIWKGGQLRLTLAGGARRTRSGSSWNDDAVELRADGCQPDARAGGGGEPDLSACSGRCRSTGVRRSATASCSRRASTGARRPATCSPERPEHRR